MSVLIATGDSSTSSHHKSFALPLTFSIGDAPSTNYRSVSAGLRPSYLLLSVRAAALASLAIIIAMSLVPGRSRPTVEIVGLLIGALGVIEHIVAYAICGCLFVIGYARLRPSTVFIALATLAFCLEITQLVIPDRTGKLSDAVLSAAGAGLGIWLGLWAKRQIWMVRHLN